MISFSGHLDVALPPAIVFERLADMAELDRWNPNVTASRRISGDRLVVGSTYLATIRRGPLRMTARSTLTEVERGRSVTYEGSISKLWSVDTLTFEPRDEGTRIVFENRTTTPTWLQPIAPILNAAFQPQARRAVEGALRYLQAHPHQSVGDDGHVSHSQAAAIVEWARRCDGADIEYWLFGGWAVDYHAGQVTRPHKDVDFVIWVRDHETVIEMLSAAEFEALRPPLAFIRNGVEFEITLIERAQDGAIVTPGFEDWPWDPGTFGDDVRALDGYQVRVVSVAGLLAVKTGWKAHLGEPPRTHDLADTQILRRLQASD